MSKSKPNSFEQKQPLYLQIYTDLLRKINSGDFPVGSKLPSEQEIAREYNVSRITSKKAMDNLAGNGYISRTPGRGTFVLKQERPTPAEAAAANRKPIIGVVIEKFSISFGGELILGIERECRRFGYTMALRCTYHDEKEEERAIDELMELGVAGMIIMCVYTETYNTKILKLVLDDFPIILVDRVMSGIPLSCVCTDNKKAARELTDILFEHGHEEITFVVAKKSFLTSTVGERADGVIESCVRHGKTPNRSDWVVDLNNPDGNYPPGNLEMLRKADIETLKHFMRTHREITGYVAASYDVAMLVLQADRECGSPQGKQREVVCFDAPESTCAVSPIIHIRQDQQEMGRLAVCQLMDRVAGKQTPRITYVDYKIVK